MNALGNLITKHLKTNQPNMTSTTEKKPETKYRCKYCGAKFDVVQHLASHIRIDHKAERKQTPLPDGRLTASAMEALHSEKLDFLARNGVGAGFRQHPDWEQILLGHGEARQTLYSAVYEWKKRKGIALDKPPAYLTAKGARAQHRKLPPSEDKAQPGQRARWTQEQYDLVKRIEGEFNANGKISWEFVFAKHPEWAQILNYANRNKFMSFVGRVRDGKAKRLSLIATTPVQEAVPVNGTQHIEVDGHQFTLEEAKNIIKSVRNALRPLPHCPECGYNLKMHAQAYAVARLHRKEED